MGGKREDFDKISLAYQILGNANTRKIYDETGEISDPVDNFNAQVRTVMDSILNQLFVQENILQIDLIEAITLMSEMKINEFDGNIKQCESIISKMEKSLTRLKKKNPDNDMIKEILTFRISDISKQKFKLEETKKIFVRVIEVAEDYVFRSEKPPEPGTVHRSFAPGFFNFTSTTKG